MTREQIDAIEGKARVAYHWPSADQSEADREVIRSVVTLLAEVERLTSEVEAKVAQNVALVGMNGRLQLEVERLTADPLPAAAWVREVERAAFQRGVAAMREEAAQHFEELAWQQRFAGDFFMSPVHEASAQRIRALPDPEDTK